MEKRERARGISGPEASGETEPGCSEGGKREKGRRAHKLPGKRKGFSGGKNPTILSFQGGKEAREKREKLFF